MAAPEPVTPTLMLRQSRLPAEEIRQPHRQPCGEDGIARVHRFVVQLDVVVQIFGRSFHPLRQEDRHDHTVDRHCLAEDDAAQPSST